MAQIGTVRLETQNSGVVDVPVFEPGDSASGIYEFVRVETASGPGFIPVTDPVDATYPYLRVQSQNNGIVAVTDTPGSDIPDSGDYQWYVNEGSGETINPDVGSVTASLNGPVWRSLSEAVGGFYVELDGNDDSIRTDNSVTWNDQWTWFGWVRKQDDFTSRDSIFSSPNAGSNGWDVTTEPSAATAEMDIWDTGDGSSITDFSFVSKGVWAFLAVIFDSSGPTMRAIVWDNDSEIADTGDVPTGGREPGNLDQDIIIGAGNYGNNQIDVDFWGFAESNLSKTELKDLRDATKR